ncbi:glycosyltransferase [Methylobacterium sp. A54F]
MSRRIYVDRTHVRGHVTGIERVAIDLFAPERLAPHTVRILESRGLAHMIAAQQLGLPARALADPAALFVFPGFPPPPLCAPFAERCLVYVHDTFLVTRSADLSLKSRLYMAPSFRLAMRWGRRFLVNSQATGAALRELCRPEAQVALLRPAVRDVFGLADLGARAGRPAGEPLRMLAIGTIEPRKDYGAAVALAAALNRGGIPAELHIVGRVGWGRHDFLADPPPWLRLHGYVDDAGLRRLVAESHLLLSTSKAEGLGLPLLEVQHGGLPVVAPEDAVFHEVLGASALLIQPTDPAGAAAALAEWVAAGGLQEAAARARPNVGRWNDLAAADAARFRDFLARGPAAYAAGGLVPAATDATRPQA